MSVSTLTAAQFDAALDAHELLVIDFFAEWCGPCKSFAKVMEAIAPEYPNCHFASVDVDKEKSLAQEFSVQSVPFVMIIRNHAILYAESGALSATTLRELLDKAKAVVF